MLTLFDMIQSSLSYINLSTVLKNRIYTILASIGNFYLLYVAFKFYQNGYWIRGTLFIVAFLGILYFAYLNLLYYFTKKKKSRFDISPWIEKKLHLKSKDPMSEAEKEERKLAPGYVQTNGIFKNENFLPATVVHNFEQQNNIQLIARQLIQMGYLKANYKGLSDDEIAAEINKTKKPFPALDTPVALPYFELGQQNGKLVVYGGLNQIERREIATVTEVGLLTAQEALKRYQLYLATAVITGGPTKVSGRTGVIEEKTPFRIEVKVAYRKRDVASTLQNDRQHFAASSTTTSFSRRSTSAQLDETPLASSRSRAGFNDFGSRTQKAPQKHWRSNKYRH